MESQFVRQKKASEALNVSSRSLQRLCQRYPSVRRMKVGRHVLICMEDLLEALQKPKATD